MRLEYLKPTCLALLEWRSKREVKSSPLRRASPLSRAGPPHVNSTLGTGMEKYSLAYFLKTTGLKFLGTFDPTQKFSNVARAEATNYDDEQDQSAVEKVTTMWKMFLKVSAM